VSLRGKGRGVDLLCKATTVFNDSPRDPAAGRKRRKRAFGCVESVTKSYFCMKSGEECLKSSAPAIVIGERTGKEGKGSDAASRYIVIGGEKEGGGGPDL